MATTAYEHDADGSKFIPATQRPDGTWRKPRRVRDGYVPQEEVPLYESKGKQFAARQNTGLPVGFSPVIVTETAKQRKNNSSSVHSASGVITNVEKKKKKKKTGVDDVVVKLAKCEIIEPTFSSPPSQTPSNSASTPADPVKRLKNLRKKLREIEALEEKVKSGVLKSLDKEQKEKISKKNDILNEIDILEKSSE